MIMAELWGVFEGLKLTSGLGLINVVIDVDSMEVVLAIEKCHAKAREGESLIRNVTDMHNAVKLEHLYRKTNKCADALAKFDYTFN